MYLINFPKVVAYVLDIGCDFFSNCLKVLSNFLKFLNSGSPMSLPQVFLDYLIYVFLISVRNVVSQCRNVAVSQVFTSKIGIFGFMYHNVKL